MSDLFVFNMSVPLHCQLLKRHINRQGADMTCVKSLDALTGQQFAISVPEGDLYMSQELIEEVRAHMKMLAQRN